MTAGRPSKYNEGMNQKIIAAFEQGYSYTAAAAEVGVAKSTCQDWEKAHPEFRVSVKEGMQKAVLFWEKINIKNAKLNEGNATSIVFGLKNRARDEWSDMSRLEHTGRDGGPIEMAELSDEQLELRIKSLMSSNE